jgi:hypothetical protein
MGDIDRFFNFIIINEAVWNCMSLIDATFKKMCLFIITTLYFIVTKIYYIVNKLYYIVTKLCYILVQFLNKEWGICFL